MSRRHQRRRRARPHVGAHRVQQQHVRSQHAAVQQVADDGDLQAGEPALVLADREGVEQRLGRMLVHAVAGVDDRRPAQCARAGAARPTSAWRITIMSGDIASRLRAVSSSVSPFVTLDVAVAMLSVSALSRFSAISNDVRVRVLGSKKRLTTVRPRSVGTFLIGAAANLLHRFGGVEDERDLVGVELGDAEQVARLQRDGRGRRVLRSSSCFPLDDHFVGRRRFPAAAPARSA